ncbi:hypothetical protein [Streptomyces sp. NPDC059909]|uniref:hypothetical protein n=1 Tax=Streptomyces sp. NPDC059909 TaxID=3346998 RepID=UPI003669DF81
MRYIGRLAVLTMCTGSLLLGCSTNECSGGSVCGGGNSVDLSGKQSPTTPTTPLTYSVSESDPWDACEGGPGKVFLRAPSLDDIAAHVNSGASQTTAEVAAYKKQLAEFDRDHNAVTADRTTITLTLQGKTSRAVTIQDITVNVADVKPTPATSVRVQRVGGCGDSNVSSFLVNLDKKVPRLEFKEGRNSTGQMRVRGFPVQITESDSEVLTLVAFTTADVHTFSLVVHWTSDGDPGTTEVKADSGALFSVASGNGGRQYDYQQQDGTFTPQRYKMDPEDPLGDPLPIEAP